MTETTAQPAAPAEHEVSGMTVSARSQAAQAHFSTMIVAESVAAGGELDTNARAQLAKARYYIDRALAGAPADHAGAYKVGRAA